MGPEQLIGSAVVRPCVCCAGKGQSLTVVNVRSWWCIPLEKGASHETGGLGVFFTLFPKIT